MSLSSLLKNIFQIKYKVRTKKFVLSSKNIGEKNGILV